MTGYKSKRAAARDKLLDDDDALTIAYKSGFYDGKKATQPAQEPVAWLCKPDKNGMFSLPTADKACKDCFPVYRQPPQRPWVGLTAEEILDLFDATNVYGSKWIEFARAVEAKLKERNHD